jgi:hypothetical protein
VLQVVERVVERVVVRHAQRLRRVGVFGVVRVRSGFCVVQTGRANGKRSSQGSAAATAPDAPRHETTGFHLFPRGGLLGITVEVEVGRVGAVNIV